MALGWVGVVTLGLAWPIALVWAYTRPQQGDPGVPPELAKLGVSSDDWAQIQSALKAETGADASIKVPEEYRGLVRSYFEEMAKGGEK